MSAIDSPRVSWSSSARRTIGVAPSSATPTSKDSRVRVEGFSKIRAHRTPGERIPPVAALAASLELLGAVEQRHQVAAIELLPGQEVARGSMCGRGGHRATDTRDVQLTAMTWNLFHGRDWPPVPELQVRGHKGNFRRGPRLGSEYEQTNWDLFGEFAALIDSVAWDVALFQEFPPSWRGRLAEACGAEAHRALSGRNWLQPITSLIGRWRPDLLGAWEGGSNTTFARGAAGPIAERRREVLTRGPELRVLALTRLEAGPSIANLHVSTTPSSAERELLDAAGRAVAFAGSDP